MPSMVYNPGNIVVNAMLSPDHGFTTPFYWNKICVKSIFEIDELF